MGDATPGPWFAGKVESSGSIQVRNAAGDLVVEVPLGWDDKSDQRAEPDARLIAAAPELLAALRATVATFEQAGLIRIGRKSACSVEVEALRQLIAKAEGSTLPALVTTDEGDGR